MNSAKLINKYQSLIDRIELIKKRPIILSHTVDMLNQIIEFCSKKKSTNTFTLKVFDQQSKNLDKIESMMDGLDDTLPSNDDLQKNKNNQKSTIASVIFRSDLNYFNVLIVGATLEECKKQKKYKNVIYSDIGKLYNIYHYIEELIKSFSDIAKNASQKKIIKDAIKTQNINLCFKNVISLKYNIDRKYYSKIIKKILWRKKYWFRRIL
tara:strand:- start:10 stop:636 length:627 start_codon:yes stop_codon:yes gene_type:complete